MKLNTSKIIDRAALSLIRALFVIAIYRRGLSVAIGVAIIGFGLWLQNTLLIWTGFIEAGWFAAALVSSLLQYGAWEKERLGMTVEQAMDAAKERLSK